MVSREYHLTFEKGFENIPFVSTFFVKGDFWGFFWIRLLIIFEGSTMYVYTDFYGKQYPKRRDFFTSFVIVKP